MILRGAELEMMDRRRGMFRRCSPHIPERYLPYKMLWVRVIIRAVYDYAMWKNSSKLVLKNSAQDAARWLFEPSTLTNSFDAVCESLNLQKDGIRNWARRLTPDDVRKLEFQERDSGGSLGLFSGGTREELDGDDQ